MSDTTYQFLSHLGKWLCDLANDRPTESSRGWLGKLAQQHSYSALPSVRDGVEQIEREMLRLRENEKVSDTQTVIDLKIAIYDERQKHQAAIAQLYEALHKRQLVIDEAATGNTEERIDKSQAHSAEFQNHEAGICLLVEERDAANAALKALQIEHGAVLEDLHDAKERRAAALHYTDQLQSILGPNLEAWHDSHSVAEDFAHGNDEDTAPSDHCRPLSIIPNSPQFAAPSTQINVTQNSPTTLEQPNHSQQEVLLLEDREKEYLQRIRDLETENERLREELQLSEQLHAITDADSSDIAEEPLECSEEVIEPPRQIEEQLQQEVTTAQKAMTSEEGSDESGWQEGVKGGSSAWRAPRVTEDLARALQWLNGWHRSHFHVMH